MLFPLVTRAFGVIGAIFGVMVVRTDDREDPKSALTRGLYVTAVLHAFGFAGAAKWLLGAHWVHFLACGALGAAAAVGLLHLTSYYAGRRYRPVRELAEASRAGPTLSVLTGLAYGLEGALTQIAAVVAAAVGAFVIGARTGLVHRGLSERAVAAMGLLGEGGPPRDRCVRAHPRQAAGIVQMSVARERQDVRGRTVVLDAVGNTVKALTKAWAAAAAALASLLLCAAYLDELGRRVVAGDVAGLAMAPASPVVRSTGRRSSSGRSSGSGWSSGSRDGRSSGSPGRRAGSSTRSAGSSRTGRPSSPRTTRPASNRLAGGPPSHDRPGGGGRGGAHPVRSGLALRPARG